MHSLVSNQDILNQHTRNIPDRTVLQNNNNNNNSHNKSTQIQDISGVILNKESRDELRTNLAVEQMSPMSRPNLASSSASPSASNHFSHNYKQSSSPVNAHSSLPWIPLNGEEFPRDKEHATRDISIMFVLPDNRVINGKLYITNFRLHFKSNELHQISSDQPCFIIIDLPLGLINRIEKIGHQSSKHVNFYGLSISCKNGRRLRFAHTNDKNSRREIYEILQTYAFPLNHRLEYFAFVYKLNCNDINGWNVYDPKKEYERMGVLQSSDWRISTINKDFRFCETYPKLLVVPDSISDERLKEIGEFRSKHRIPVVSWIKYDSKTFRAALLRSSQPLVGLNKKRNEADEAYLNTLFALNTNNSLDKLFIVDARPLVNAVANRGNGGGYEIEDYYKKCEIQFLNIQNIHVMRESLRKVYEMALPSSASSSSASSTNTTASQTPNNATNNSNQNSANLNDDKNYLVNLDNSKWLEHIKLVLNGALKIVRYITQHRASVLVHCSDGWDRTAQLTSLSMLMMDKYYRTIRGFEVLIEKEWLSFGHRFGIRMGHGSDKHSDQDRSPIFLQFVDCVWQMLQQNGKVFEFNDKLLLAIVQNMYSNQFGTFLYNNEFERESHSVRSKTVSLWSYINSNINEFKNNSYVEYDGVVEFSTTYASLQLWTAYYFQYKEQIDDSSSESILINYSKMNRSTHNLTGNVSTSNLVANPAAKINVQAFLQQMVNQMKSSVRSNSSQEPELIRYRATVPSE